MRIHYPSVILSGLCGYALLILWGTWNGPLDLPEDRREVVSSMHEKAEGSVAAQTFSATAAYAAGCSHDGASPVQQAASKVFVAAGHLRIPKQGRSIKPLP